MTAMTNTLYIEPDPCTKRTRDLDDLPFGSKVFVTLAENTVRHQPVPHPLIVGGILQGAGAQTLCFTPSLHFHRNQIMIPLYEALPACIHDEQ